MDLLRSLRVPDKKLYATLLQRAKAMRSHPTQAEAVFWHHVRANKIKNLRFYRQVPIGRFIVDFYCPRIRLAVEIDGEIHQESEQREYDEMREFFLREHEIHILRFTNDQVEQDIDAVFKAIEDHCKVDPPSS